eukprot:SAG11_NODE_3547_length_2377_cov_3.176471_5_plen_160_part_00
MKSKALVLASLVAAADFAMASKREELIQRGYTIFPEVVGPELVAELSAAVNERVATMDHYVTPDGLKHTRHKGDHLHLAFNRKVVERPMGGAEICHPSMARLVCHEGCLAALDEVGCTDKKFWSGYVLSKPAGAPPLYWCELLRGGVSSKQRTVPPCTP